MFRQTFEQIIRKCDFPLLPSEDICFEPVDNHVDISRLYKDLQVHLKHFHMATSENPFANPILLLAVHIARWIENGKLTFSALEQMTQFLNSRAFVCRAERLHRYVGTVDPIENLKAVECFLNRFSTKEKPDFQHFSTEISRELFGIVITAHPTFALSDDLMRALAELAGCRNMAGSPLSESQVREIIRRAVVSEHLPDPEITIEKEHGLALEAIANLQRALLRIYDLTFRVARSHFPERWWEVHPRLMTIASWVGYDLDGRRDIDWIQSFAFRLEEKKLSLERYSRTLQTIIDFCPIDNTTESLRTILAQTLLLLTENLKDSVEEINTFQCMSAGDEEGIEKLRKVSRKMYTSLSSRLTTSKDLLDLLERAISSSQTCPEILHRLCLLRSEVENYGLGVSHIHVRLNAKQIHNAIRGLIGIETDPEDPGNKKTYLKALDQLLAGVKPVTINFGSLIAERTTAKRLFMLVAQILKYIDSDTPIRFLIAETESSFTPIAALYFAKLFGVAEKVEISPLFETPGALVRGARIVDEMLSNPFYRDYVLAKGSLCMQTGFSDAGRHLGQTAASFAIENFRRSLADSLQKYGLSRLKLVIFNTHGESIGRGAHPADFHARLAYTMSHRSRSELLETGVQLKEELSFQGGDGYLYFLNPCLAMAVITRILEFAAAHDGSEDSFYREKDYIFEFFATVQQFNQRIMEDPDYSMLLNEYGKYLLYPTGSRSIKREFEIEKRQVVSAAQIRAIPQNAVLHQLGLLSNTISGVGHAIKKNPEQFDCLQQESDRFNLLISMWEYALSFSDFYAFDGYLKILDPGFWLMTATKAANSQHACELRKVADFLEHLEQHANLSRVGRIFYRDLLDLTEVLDEMHCRRGVVPKSFPCYRDGLWMNTELRDHLEIFHAMRLALIYHVFTLAVQVPEFSPQRGITREEIIERILHLDVETAVGILKNIFPLLKSSAETQDFSEKATYQTEQYLGYFQEHKNIFNPLESLDKLIKRITAGITHITGSFG